MRKFIVLLTFLLCMAGAAKAQNYVAGSVTIAGPTSVTNTTPSTSTTTGALVVAGGLGVGGNIYGNGNELTITPTGGTTASLLANIASRIITPMDFGAVGNGTTDDSAAINSAITYIENNGGGTLFFPSGKTFAICANPITISHSGNYSVNLLGNSSSIILQPGCASPPQELLLLDYTNSPNEYAANSHVSGFVLNGECATKYIVYDEAGQALVFHDTRIENPAPASAISGSAGVYLAAGNERQLGQSNWVTATNTCYTDTTGLPAYGIYDTGGNDDFTGVIVVNYNIGIYSEGDNQFGPGTHIWGGCAFNSGCTFDANLRTSIGIELHGYGYADDVEIDDPSTVGISMEHGAFTQDREVVIGTNCIFSQTPASTQYCVVEQSNLNGSVALATVAPQLQAAGYNNNIQYSSGTGNANDIIGAAPYVGMMSGVGLIHMSASSASFTVGTACVGAGGLVTGQTSCESTGWYAPTSCTVTGFAIAQDTATPTADTVTYQIYVNGVAQGATATSPAGSYGVANSVQNIVVAPGDTIGFGITTSGTTGGSTNLRGAIMGCG